MHFGHMHEHMLEILEAARISKFDLPASQYNAYCSTSYSALVYSVLRVHKFRFPGASRTWEKPAQHRKRHLHHLIEAIRPTIFKMADDNESSSAAAKIFSTYELVENMLLHIFDHESKRQHLDVRARAFVSRQRVQDMSEIDKNDLKKVGKKYVNSRPFTTPETPSYMFMLKICVSCAVLKE